MPTGRKRTKTTRGDPKNKSSSVLLSDYRTCWLVRNDEPAVDLEAKGEVFSVHKSILTAHSEYFKSCLGKSFAEGVENKIQFDDIEPQYLGYYLGLAASFSSIVPHIAPRVKDRIETPIRDFIEVYKLCDRFMSAEMAEFMHECIEAASTKGHCGLWHAGPRDEALQKRLMREFADGYEALQLEHPPQAAMGAKMVDEFCEGVSFAAWDAYGDDVIDRPRFVSAVSKGFARKLIEASNSRSKLKRKFLGGSN
ncbi:hypothetical protein HIM_07275 [Hirsutella minnesotensis 3608]|uniref:BTB domain-containing protein n=1 Tax=Hirsutella minnesotensis 3608 TaxID=1043627 RepID=A0A0F7ZHZ5_9HYPO|nr:hypothetical protein HIM_07275 [Hirsutella minnesotensis 3608]